MVVYMQLLTFLIASVAHAGYIYNNTAAPEQILMNYMHIEVPTDNQVVSRDGHTTFYDVIGEFESGRFNTPNAIHEAEYPFAAKFGWDGDLGVVSCLTPGSTSNSWRRVVQFVAPRGDPSNPATDCQPRENVDCVNWLEPERLKEMCASLLVQRKALESR